MKNIASALFTFLLTFNASAQSIPTSCFTVGGFGIERLFSSTPTFDGNFILAGTTNTWNDGGNDRNLYLVKCDASGNILWTHSQGCYPYDDLFSVIETSDHSLVITGGINDDLLLAKYASDGTPLWTKQVDFFGTETGFDVIETSEGGYLISGEAFQGLGDTYSAVMKLDADGNVIWNKVFLTGSGFDLLGWAITETSDHHYVIAGQTSSFDDFPFVLCLDTNGNEIWGKETTNSGVWYDAVVTADSGVVMAGYHCYSGCDASLMKVNKDGDTVWSHAYPTPLFDVFYSISSTADGGFIAAGKATDQIDTSYGYIVKCGSHGDLQWSKAIYDASFISIHQTTDGGYVACGNLGTDFQFVKLDADGKSCPDCGSFSYGVQNSGTSLSDASFTLLTQAATVLDTTLTEHTGGVAHLFCNEVGIEETAGKDESVIIFPNPASENFKIEIPSHFIVRKISIVDMNGKIIYSNSFSSQRNLSPDASSFPNGIYSVQLIGEKKTTSGKLAVIH